MSQEMLSEGAYNPRSALGDVTNLIGKRGLSSIYKKDESIHISKKECLRVDESYNKQTADCVSTPQLCGEVNSLTGSVSKVVCEVKEPRVPGVRENDAMIYSAMVKDGDVLRDVSESTHLMIAVPLDENGPHGTVEVEGDGTTDCIVVPQVGLKLNTMVGNDLGVDDGNAVSLLDGSGVLQSQESRCGFERCVGQKGDGSSSACMEMIKTCTCSFCRKAACLWSDIYSQDIKGRINAIKKSQKQASILVDRNSMNGSRNFGKVPNSESDLTGRWKSLFLHMENVFVHEGTQLGTTAGTARLLPEKTLTRSVPETARKLRTDCLEKTDLVNIQNSVRSV